MHARATSWSSELLICVLPVISGSEGDSTDRAEISIGASIAGGISVGAATVEALAALLDSNAVPRTWG
jgi:hypothetical protein